MSVLLIPVTNRQLSKKECRLIKPAEGEQVTLHLTDSRAGRTFLIFIIIIKVFFPHWSMWPDSMTECWCLLKKAEVIRDQERWSEPRHRIITPSEDGKWKQRLDQCCYCVSSDTWSQTEREKKTFVLNSLESSSWQRRFTLLLYTTETIQLFIIYLFTYRGTSTSKCPPLRFFTSRIKIFIGIWRSFSI